MTTLNDSAAGSLRAAIAAANDETANPGADTILFDSSLFAAGPETTNLTTVGDTSEGNSAFAITSEIIIQGPTGSNGLTLAGPGNTGNPATSMRHFLVTSSGDLTLNHLTLTGGYASSGGAIRNQPGGNLVLRASTITGNAADFGGGLRSAGTLLVADSTFQGNSATANGGAILSGTSSITNITNSTFSGNSGRYGGAIGARGTMTVTNSTITDNNATNTAFAFGGGGLHNNGQVHLFNNIIAGNFLQTTVPEDIANNPTTAFNNIVGSPKSNSIADGVNGNHVGVDVNDVLMPTLADNGGPTLTYALVNDSSNLAIDGGRNADAGLLDQRFFTRIVNGTVDIGAVESGASAPPTDLVVTTVDDKFDGFTAADLSLREAIFLANLDPDANTITFDPVLFGTPQTISVTTQLVITDDLTITGPGASLLTVSGANNVRVFNVDDGTGAVKVIEISGMTVADGFINAGTATGGGAGIRNAEDLTLRDSVVTGNSATSGVGGIVYGAGILNDAGTLVLDGVTVSNNLNTGYNAYGGGVGNQGGTLTIGSSLFEDNQATATGTGTGGGGALANNAQLSIADSTFRDNTVDGQLGGGALFNRGTASIERSTFAGNRNLERNGGGAISNLGLITRIADSTFVGNRAEDGSGGAIFNPSPAVISAIVNTTFSGNTAVNGAGGALLLGGTVGEITNVTITGNTAGFGGGIALGGTLTNLRNSIVAGNLAPTIVDIDIISGGITNAFNNLLGTPIAGTPPTNSGGNIIDPNPLLGPLQDNGGPTFTHALLTGSPALNAGNNAFAAGIDFDQRGPGFPRIVDGVVDIGAFESDFVPPPPPPPVDFVRLIAVGAAAGGGPHVKVFNVDGSLRFSFFAYDAAFTGGVRVAVGDVNGDNTDDIITAAGPGAGPHVKVFDGATGAEIRSFFAFDPAFIGGVHVAAGDIDGDSFADIIIGADAGGGPHVKVFSGQDGSVLRSFFAYEAAFTGGVRVAAGDVNGDTVDDIITAAGPGGGPHVKVFSGSDHALLASFFAFNASFSGGIFVSAGDLDGDRRADIVAANSSGQLNIFDGASGQQTDSFRAFDDAITSATRPAVLDLDGDDVAEILVGRGKRTPPEVRVFDGLTLDQIDSFFAFEQAFTGGVFVA